MNFWSKKHYFWASKTEDILDVVSSYVDTVELLRV